MARKPYGPRECRPPAARVPASEASPELTRILGDLESPEEEVRARAVRELCPCRGAAWEIAIFPRVLALRSDPSPVVRRAVEHDLEENRWWGERSEARRLEGRRARQEMAAARDEIDRDEDPSAAEEAGPTPHSLAWRRPRRPRSRKGYYSPGR